MQLCCQSLTYIFLTYLARTICITLIIYIIFLIVIIGMYLYKLKKTCQCQSTSLFSRFFCQCSRHLHYHYTIHPGSYSCVLQIRLFSMTRILFRYRNHHSHIRFLPPINHLHNSVSDQCQTFDNINTDILNSPKEGKKNYRHPSTGPRLGWTPMRCCHPCRRRRVPWRFTGKLPRG